MVLNGKTILFYEKKFPKWKFHGSEKLVLRKICWCHLCYMLMIYCSICFKQIRHSLQSSRDFSLQLKISSDL